MVDAQATFARKPAAGADEAKPPHPLFGAPDFTLVLPQARTRNGVGQTTKDLTEHPWAGVDVMMTLVARDEANNEGRSAPQECGCRNGRSSSRWPRALIEQRRILALDANAKDQVLTALDALTIAPERFTPETNVYLGLRSIYWQLARAKSDDELRDVVERLWSMAVLLEDGNVSDAEKALRAAQDALREALERGATDEEIKRLMDQLRAALDKFLQALAEEMRKNPQAARPLDPNSMRALRSQDLQSMLDRMERLARSGARDAAKQLLEQLQQMLENLQMARPGGQMGDQDDEMSSALDELGDMIRQQQQLRDRTFRQGQDQRRQQRGQQRGDQQGDPNAFGELRQDQQALRDQLNKLLEELRKRGFPQPGQQGQQGSRAASRISSAAPARPWATPRARSARAMPTARSMRRAARSKRCARARRGWRNRCSSRWARAPARASPAAWGRRAPTRTPIRSAGRCAGATTATTPRSRCRARSTCSARAASSRSCASASARASARSSSSTTSSGC